jgi:hypothetical protein
VLTGKVVDGRKTVAAADDDHVIGGLEVRARRQIAGHSADRADDGHEPFQSASSVLLAEPLSVPIPFPLPGAVLKPDRSPATENRTDVVLWAVLRLHEYIVYS